MKNKPGILSNLFGFAFLILNLFTVCWLGLCYMASVTHPEKVKDIALFSLTTPYAIAANAFFVIFWLLSRWKLRSVLSLLALLACYKVILMVFAFNFFGPNDFSHDAQTLKLMSWNVHGLGIYDKKGNKNATGILDEIKKENPDVLCMPEYYAMASDTLKPYVKKVLQAGDFKNYRFHIDNTFGYYTLLGTAVFTKYPILHYQAYRLGHTGVHVLECDMQVTKERIIRMFFVHLYSFSLSDEDRDYLSSVKAKKVPGEKDIKQSRSYIWRFNAIYKLRAIEADSIARIMAQSPYPVLICGDFNDLPGSYTYTAIRRALDDAFVEKGAGLGRTYNQIAPTLRIDHIFYDPTALQITGYKSPALYYSDHNPVIANFRIK